ncbi:unnamed protein product [Timema podura]|uniref:HTH psq-type domain-containing protein n=1 Tax=Timema podura TaxID=61482 RepID=A0ABN7NIH3_TIMPD|nr:unnamed protein product [Timema podura]
MHIIREIEKGKSKSDVSRELGLASSTVATIWKNRESVYSAYENNVPKSETPPSQQNNVNDDESVLSQTETARRRRQEELDKQRQEEQLRKQQVTNHPHVVLINLTLPMFQFLVSPLEEPPCLWSEFRVLDCN